MKVMVPCWWKLTGGKHFRTNCFSLWGQESTDFHEEYSQTKRCAMSALIQISVYLVYISNVASCPDVPGVSSLTILAGAIVSGWTGCARTISKKRFPSAIPATTPTTKKRKGGNCGDGGGNMELSVAAEQWAAAKSGDN